MFLGGQQPFIGLFGESFHLLLLFLTGAQLKEPFNSFRSERWVRGVEQLVERIEGVHEA